MSSMNTRSSRTRSRSPIQNNSNVETSSNISAVGSSSSGDMSSKASLSEDSVHVRNIPLKCKLEEVRDLFEEKVGNVKSVELIKEKGKFKGQGIVQFKDKESAQKAVDTMFKHRLRGRRLVVKLECDNTDNQPSASVSNPPDKPDNVSRPNPEFDTFGLDSELLKTLGISGPLTKRVLVFNIDKQVTEEKLEAIFKMAGNTVKVKIHNTDENSKGSVEYEHPQEAVQAISMLNGQKLYNEVIQVVMGPEEETNSIDLPSGLHGIGKGLGPNGEPLNFEKLDAPTKDKKAEPVDKKPSVEVKGSGSPKGNTLGTSNSAPPGTCVLSCSICLLNCVQPVLLPCYHIFCFLCVKGVTRSSQLCPLCRREIPPNFLNHPQLVPTTQPTLAFDGSYQWFYEGRNGWWQYDDRTSSDIEAAYQRKESQYEVLIAGILYIIDFQDNVQMRKTDYGRRRRIKRDLITINKKGVAGVRANPDVEVVNPVPSGPRVAPELVDIDIDDDGDDDVDYDDDEDDEEEDDILDDL